MYRIDNLTGIAGAFTWMQDRHKGIKVDPGCRMLNVTAESVRGVFTGELFRKLYAIYQAYMGQPIMGVDRILQTTRLPV